MGSVDHTYRYLLRFSVLSAVREVYGSEFGEVFKSLSLRCWARGGLGLGFLTWWKDCVGFLLKEG